MEVGSDKERSGKVDRRNMQECLIQQSVFKQVAVVDGSEWSQNRALLSFDQCQ